MSQPIADAGPAGEIRALAVKAGDRKECEAQLLRQPDTGPASDFAASLGAAKCGLLPIVVGADIEPFSRFQASARARAPCGAYGGTCRLAREFAPAVRIKAEVANILHNVSRQGDRRFLREADGSFTFALGSR